MELSPGLHRIGTDRVAVHLVVDETGVTIIDAGLAGHRRALLRELRGLGRGLGEVRGVVLTHGDTDHLGFAERLRADHGVPVHLRPADAARARGEERSSPSWDGARLLPTLGFLVDATRHGGLRTRYLTETVPIEDGQTLDLPGAPRVIGLPGHSPGSVAIHIPAVRAVFVGDALTTRHVLTGVTGPQPAPFTDDPELADSALDALRDLDVDWVIPGHGAPWRGGTRPLLDAYRAAALR